ncbi:hypothetical protein ARAM_001116 [Aspergillus rambellii]|uniref:ER transporter 6TM N-terminal domain-containing protein n=1 Tax=Aspergillus rambellii TaxID=308745 RepID=A0A0F8VBU5_9EURO|nr:hypothetical protein ARAM_001116 [Aspergillus rambellii]
MSDVQPSDVGDETQHHHRRLVLPAWLDHWNARDLKVLFRCCAAAWVASLLMFIGPALQNIGIATFFATLMLYIVPPSGILFIYLLGAFSLLFGMCLAWAWGLLTMKAALAARPEAQTQAMVQALQREAVAVANQTGISPLLEAQILVHDGFMLDARVTVIFYVMICLFVYVMSRIRAANPKFVLTQLFGIIVADLFLLFGPTLPSFNALLPEVLVKPGAIGIGIGAACCLVFFPQSTSHVVRIQMEQLLRLGDAPLRHTRSRFAGDSIALEQLLATKTKMIGIFKAMHAALAFLPIDFSRGRWSSDDIKHLQAPLRQVVLSVLSLNDYHIARIRVDQKLASLPTESDTDRTAAHEKRPHPVGQWQLQESADLIQILKSLDYGVIRSQTLDILNRSTHEVLSRSSESLDIIAQCIHTVNSGRWFRRPTQHRVDELMVQTNAMLQNLRSAKALCSVETTERLIENHADLFDADGHLKAPDELTPYSLRGMVIGMVVEERILDVATALEQLMTQLVALMAKRTKDRFWFPSRLRYGFSWLGNRHQDAPVPGLATDSTVSPDDVEDQAKEAQRQLKISRGYGRPIRRSVLSRILRASYRWFTNPGGIYALRMVVVTIATAIPASLPQTAGFYYREKGIWGIITAQTTVLVYMADFTLSLVSRTAGTVVGGVLAMVAWYIGSGDGPGNPYGLAAITALMTIILMWWRLFLPPAFTIAAVMSGATFVLVIGFSYDDGHTQQYGLPGRGYVAFWKRLVTVLLGVVAALITLSNTMRTLSDHYALLLSHWGRTEGSRFLGPVAEKISIEVAEGLMAIQDSISVLKFEMTLGPFNQQALAETRVLCQDLNQSLGRLLALSATLPPEFQTRLAQTTGMLDDDHIGDIMAVLSVIEQALKSGIALPERLPTPLIKRCYNAWYSRNRAAELSTTLFRDENYRRYCVAISAYLKFLSTIDDIVLVLKGALGESHIIQTWETDVPV